MRKTVLVCSLVLLACPACRRAPQKQQSYVEQLAAPPTPGGEEKWVEPAEPEKPKPPPEPPPPPVPTSPPPGIDLGFTFGEQKNATMKVCTKAGNWSKREGNYFCSKTPEGTDIAGKPMLSFCDDKLCAVGLAIVLEEKDWSAWEKRFGELKQALVAKHGAPTVDQQNVAAECQNENFLKCLDDGKASAEATWKWKEGHRVSLTMSKKKSGDGPSAIRFVSIAGGGQ